MYHLAKKLLDARKWKVKVNVGVGVGLCFWCVLGKALLWVAGRHITDEVMVREELAAYHDCNLAMVQLRCKAGLGQA